MKTPEEIDLLAKKMRHARFWRSFDRGLWFLTDLLLMAAPFVAIPKKEWTAVWAIIVGAGFWRGADRMFRRFVWKVPRLKDWWHKREHLKLHHSLDVLIGDWISQTENLPSRSSVMQLMEWSHQQTLEPTEPKH